MEKKKVLYLFLFIAFAYFALTFFESARLKYMTKENGILTNAEVYKRPECGKSSNTMKVLLDRKVFTLDIGKNDCIQGQYSIGDVVEVLYCRECGQAILPESNAIFRYWLSLVFFAIPLYLLILLVFSFKKKSY